MKSITQALKRMPTSDMDDLVPGFRNVAQSALLAGAAVFALFAVLHLAFLAPALRMPMFAAAASTSFVLVAFYAGLRARVVPNGATRLATVVLMFGAWFNSALHLLLSGEPMQTTNLAVVLIASGVLLHGRAEMLASIVLAWSALAIAVTMHPSNATWFHYLIHMIDATALGAGTFIWKRMAIIANRDLRENERRAREDAEVNLRRARGADTTLRESEELFRTFFSLAPVGLAVNRMDDGHFEMGSKALFEMVGYSETEFAKLTYWDITPHEYNADEACQLESLRLHGRYGPYEKEYIRKGGERFPVLLYGRRMTDASGQDLILSVVQDISAQKATQAALASARDTAETANVAKSRFLATMSHELRTPLNAILGFSEIIAKETFGAAGCQQYIEYAGIINDSGRHLLSLINDILDLSKIEAGKFEINPEPIDARELIADALRLAGEKQSPHGGPVPSAVVAPDLPLLTADRRAALQMIVNLVSNAVKFTPASGSVTVEASRMADGGLAICVADSGIGIAKCNIAKALAPFSQIDDGVARKQGGTGLGLAIVKSLIELHGGSIALDSDTGKGTRATLTFPPPQRAANAA